MQGRNILAILPIELVGHSNQSQVRDWFEKVAGRGAGGQYYERGTSTASGQSQAEGYICHHNILNCYSLRININKVALMLRNHI